jgi:hypothetical protein
MISNNVGVTNVHVFKDDSQSSPLWCDDQFKVMFCNKRDKDANLTKVKYPINMKAKASLYLDMVLFELDEQCEWIISFEHCYNLFDLVGIFDCSSIIGTGAKVSTVANNDKRLQEAIIYYLDENNDLCKDTGSFVGCYYYEVLYNTTTFEGLSGVCIQNNEEKIIARALTSLDPRKTL